MSRMASHPAGWVDGIHLSAITSDWPKTHRRGQHLPMRPQQGRVGWGTRDSEPGNGEIKTAAHRLAIPQSLTCCKVTKSGDMFSPLATNPSQPSGTLPTPSEQPFRLQIEQRRRRQCPSFLTARILTSRAHWQPGVALFTSSSQSFFHSPASRLSRVILGVLRGRSGS